MTSLIVHPAFRTARRSRSLFDDNAFRKLLTLDDDVFRVRNDVFFGPSDLSSNAFVEAATTTRASSTRSEVSETDDSFNVSVEVPGVPRENISVTIDQGVLKITGKQRTQKPGSSSAQRFSYAYRIRNRGNGIDEAKISASLDNGILSIGIPKIPPPLPRSIHVHSPTVPITAASTTPAEVDNDMRPTSESQDVGADVSISDSAPVSAHDEGAGASTSKSVAS